MPESTNLVSGLASESEDIRSHIFSFKEFLKMMSKGKIKVGPAILLGLGYLKIEKNNEKILRLIQLSDTLSDLITLIFLKHF